MKLIHGNVSLFSHLVLGGLPAAPCPSRPARGLDGSSRRAQVGETLKNGHSGDGKQRAKDC